MGKCHKSLWNPHQSSIKTKQTQRRHSPIRGVPHIMTAATKKIMAIEMAAVTRVDVVIEVAAMVTGDGGGIGADGGGAQMAGRA